MNFRWLAMPVVCVLAAPGAWAQTPPKADPSKGQAIVSQVCVTCHALDGNSAQPVNPVLAGQHAGYTAKQLANFKSQGGKPAERPHNVMGPMVANLSVEDMRDLAAYFEMQQPKPRTARDAELVMLGQAIYRGGVASAGIAACSACHGPNGAGMPVQFPRLAGQYAEYTAAQLRAFRAGTRANDRNRMMRAVAGKLSDKEIAAVAEYISGLR
ncbi:MAG: cytochrome c4 [Betaproteobacteria bacterium]|nr:cytochrome c4 [Betaproteobacteria bacterium]MDH3437149.1 cytochrome c4 [Betaproteobacteria bacterium]